MAINYSDNEHVEALLFVLEDHASWFHMLLQNIFYPEEAHLLKPIEKPTSFAQWLVKATTDGGAMPPEIIEKLSALHSDLFKVSDALMQISSKTKKKPDRQAFQKFITVYEEFLLYIRRIERDIVLDGIGYDAFTGLRSKKLVRIDIERELQRLARQGKNFCVAMVKIDNFDLIEKYAEQTEKDGYIKLVSSLIKLSIRSFDDAYYMGGNEFILCLKQAEVSGGVSALDRLRKELENQDVIISDDKPSLSMSCCIAEPVEGDNADELIRNLRFDLSLSQNKKADTVLEHHELSPLQRYVQSNKE